jgi:hypothetical protein
MKTNVLQPPGGILLSASTCAVIAQDLARELRGVVSYGTTEIIDGFMAPQAAADYLGVSRKRVHDLTSMNALVPDGRDGRTPLFSRATLDAYVRGALTQ